MVILSCILTSSNLLTLQVEKCNVKEKQFFEIEFWVMFVELFLFLIFGNENNSINL